MPNMLVLNLLFNMRKIIFLLLLCLACLSVAAQGNRISLNGTWKFMYAKSAEDANRYQNFYKSAATPAFKDIPVPSNWAVLGYEEPVYRGFRKDRAGEGFYIKEFETPKGWGDSDRILLHFGGVWSSAEVWLNGIYLGLHESGYTSFAFDASKHLEKNGKQNRLAVRVRQVNRSYKFDVYDDWTIGGICRDVELERMPANRYIDYVQAVTDFDDNYTNANLRLRIMVSDRNRNSLGNYPAGGKEKYQLRITLNDAEGKQVAANTQTIPCHRATDREIPITLPIKRPRQWTAETPYLYNLRVELIDGGDVTHVRLQHIGFREIEIKEGGVFCINGQPVKLRGVNRHDEHPDVGRATNRKYWLEDITLMKEANINYIRLSHYTPARGFIELCDSLGMYCGNEVSLGGAEEQMYDPSLNGAVLQRVYETVIRDLNSPSIVYWSIGNEDPFTALHLMAVKAVKAFDSTRPVLLPWRTEEWLPSEIDILAPHYWKPSEYDRLAKESKRPIISTEYTHAYGNDGMGSLEACWRALTKHPNGIGAAIWMWTDQGLKTTVRNPKGAAKEYESDDEYLRLNGDGWDGIINSYRRPTADYWEARAVYAQAYTTVKEVSFKPGQKSIDIPIQNDYDFTCLSTVRMDYIIYCDEKPLAKGSGKLSTCKPHAQTTYALPLSSIKKVQSGKTYYAHLSFIRPDGKEITKQSVELRPTVSEELKVKSEELKVQEAADAITLSAGKAQFVIGKQNGQLIAVSNDSKQIIKDVHPVIWRPLDACEVTAFSKKDKRDKADLTKYNATVHLCEINKQDDKIIVTTNVTYTVDPQNKFTVNYRYTVTPDSKMNVSYTLQPQIQRGQVPIVGMTVEAVPELNDIEWLGLGPWNAYANKGSACLLGVWGGTAGSKDVVGNKQIRRMTRSAKGKGGFTIEASEEVTYMEHTATTPQNVNILCGVFSRPEKGRQAETTFPTMRTNVAFYGKFTISLNK